MLATQAYLGRRKDQFRQEFLLALKMLQEGHATPADMRSSWAGAMGHTQFLPSRLLQHAVDFDGDGRRDIWSSVPDALASAASNWSTRDGSAASAGPTRCVSPSPSTARSRSRPSRCRSMSGCGAASSRPTAASSPRDEQAEPASLLLPEGIYGPAFLTPKNYYVIKDYNFSDLYVLFVGHLADRIGDPRPFETPWSKVAQLRTAQVEAMQRRLTELGLYQDKIDGKAGMLTRAALGAYQKANGLKVDCWPTSAVLDHMRNRGTR